VGGGAPIYLAAVLEYLAAEILELAGNIAKDDKRKRISPRHIQLAVRDDDELNQVLKGVVIPQGGVVPVSGGVLNMLRWHRTCPETEPMWMCL
jgi:histone H2A